MEMKRHLDSIDAAKMKIVLQLKNDYNAGKIGLADAKRILKEKVGSLKPYEIALAEQELKEFDENECQKEDIQKMLELFEDIMDTSRPKLAENHPIMCYYRENDALLKIMLEIEDLAQYPLIKNQWLEIYDRLALYKLHFSRKQNQLYSMLERKGFDRPTHTMWTLDDFVWDEIGQARELLDDGDEDAFVAMQPTLVADLRDLISKEENVLYPTSPRWTPVTVRSALRGSMQARRARSRHVLLRLSTRPPAATSRRTCWRSLAGMAWAV